MNQLLKLTTILAVCIFFILPVHGQVSSKFFPLDDEVPLPEGMGSLAVTWNSTGMDPDGNIYVVYCDEKGTLRTATNTTGNHYSDCALTRFNPETEKWEILGSFVRAMKDASNWNEGENIEKGHTSVTYCDGKMYMGTMEFHSMQGSRKKVDSVMQQYRGAHLLAYDIESDKLEDVTAYLPGGVVFPHQGMITCDALPEYHYIFCFSMPTGDLALFNTQTNKVDTIIKGPPEMYGYKVFRKVIATPGGKVYYGFRDYKSTNAYLYVLDLNTLEYQQLMDMPPGVLNGYAWTSDRKKCYAVNMGCNIYTIDVENDNVSYAGNLIPEELRVKFKTEEDAAITTGIVLSKDNSKIYSVLQQAHEVDIDSDQGRIHPNGKRYAGLHIYGVVEFDPATGRSRIIDDLSGCVGLDKESGYLMGRLSGSGLMDEEGRFYVARNTDIGLIRIDPGIQASAKQKKNRKK